MRRLSSVEVQFKRAQEGWTFNSSYPRVFGQPSIYLLTDAQKAALEESLYRVVLWSRVLAFVLVGLSVFALFMVPDFANRLDAGSPGMWLLVCVVSIVLASVLVPLVLFIRHRAIQPVLRAARYIGPAQPDWLGFVILKDMVKLYMERKSVKVLIIWTALLLLFSTYNAAVYALLLPARSALILFGIVVSWLATLWYAALLAFKLRAQSSQ